MRALPFLLLAAAISGAGFWAQEHSSLASDDATAARESVESLSESFKDRVVASDGFSFPVGSGHADGYYNAQLFGKNDHLGEDWNGNGGGDTDLGDPVKAVAHGVVLMAGDAGKGWGNVVRLLHNAGTDDKPEYVESLYAHLDSMTVSVGKRVERGQVIGTIGTAKGAYLAHLHLELRDSLDMPIGRGYSKNARGYLNPTAFIESHLAPGE
jgi:murein DD-endopeptidase MepM/ murein hydrolase activator NlpD